MKTNYFKIKTNYFKIKFHVLFLGVYHLRIMLTSRASAIMWLTRDRWSLFISSSSTRQSGRSSTRYLGLMRSDPPLIFIVKSRIFNFQWVMRGLGYVRPATFLTVHRAQNIPPTPTARWQQQLIITVRCEFRLNLKRSYRKICTAGVTKNRI